MQVHENEEDWALSLAEEAKHVLSFIHNRDKNNNKRQENSKFTNYHYHIQDIKDTQRKKIQHDLGLLEVS